MPKLTKEEQERYDTLQKKYKHKEKHPGSLKKHDEIDLPDDEIKKKFKKSPKTGRDERWEPVKGQSPEERERRNKILKEIHKKEAKKLTMTFQDGGLSEDEEKRKKEARMDVLSTYSKGGLKK